ncbi:retrovirus-related Pol polyprotein from transposon TNT 1-94 [Trichonephila inaurata madagascariensis]|uniref:Retrovirus-related Pol polyprotein from transposon TNT 1-94 n=1 Tax=Trichonephila inaurata madagascariensis TaxID=2747483 RepID=A0A8X6YST5_9ARAC|nr:retrovirus-related Pol polyprotein from transposon TNT 1-94 [Trichonephila inaurata madagascariensis]
MELRNVLTIVDGARTVLSESGLDKSFWPEAVLYFEHVWNKLCQSAQTLTPIELYIGIKPSTRHPRPFGSTLYVGTPRLLKKPRQSNRVAVLEPLSLKFSDYEVIENSDHDKTVNKNPVSLPQNSDSETEDEELSRTDIFLRIGKISKVKILQ